MVKKHIFFDLDHTLWDFDKNSGFAFETIFKKHNIVLDCNLFLKHYVPINQDYWRKYQMNEVTHQELRFGRFNDVFKILNYEVSADFIDQMSEDYILHLPDNNYLFDGAVEVLEYLNKKYLLHIITNWFSEVQDKKLERSNIKHFFNTVTNSEKAGQKKPHPVIFSTALKLANATKEESIMIGDSPEADIKGALDFGIDAVFFNPEEQKINFETKQIRHLKELMTFL